MEDWLSQIEAHTGPRYLAIADAIDDAVRRGQLGTGEKLPPQRALARRLGITVGTVTRAYAEAERRGLVAGQVGRGTFVADRSAAVTPTASVLWPEGGEADRSGPIDLASDSPVVGFDDAELAGSLQSYAETGGFRALLSGAGGGPSPSEAAALAAWHADLKDAPDAQILPTNGGDGVLVALLKTLAPARGTVLVEALAGRPERSALDYLGLRASPVQIDDEGIIPESLELAAWSSGAGILVCTPGLHDPTTATLSAERRAAIADIAERFDLTLVELEGQARLLDRPLPPLTAFAPERTVYVASLASILAPWLALGYVAAPEPLAGRIEDGVARSGVGAPALTRGIAARWVEDRFAHSLLSLQRTEARWRGRLARSVLSEHAFAVRQGGLRAWVRPQRPDGFDIPDLADRALAAGVTIVPAGAFEMRRGSPPAAFRLSLGACGGPARLRQGLDTLLSLFDDR